MKERSSHRIGWLGPLLVLAGAALLLIAATQYLAPASDRPAPSPSPPRTTAPAIHAAATMAQAPSRTVTPPARVTDAIVGAAPLSATTLFATPIAIPTTLPSSPPTHLTIPSIGLDQPVVEVSAHVETIDGQQVLVWDVADYAVGHNNTSADPGQGGNVVLAGHDDWHGEVFRDLHTIQQGASITVTTADGKSHRYVVDQILYRQEVGVPLSERLKTGELIGPTDDERLTLVTCWPYGVDDHRLIVIARPAG